jgi:hypothetical protein
MAVLLGEAGNSERLGAGFHDHTGWHSPRQQCDEAIGLTPHLLDDFTSAISNAHLTVAATQIDADMLHGQAPLASQYQGPQVEASHFILSVQAPTTTRSKNADEQLDNFSSTSDSTECR